MQSLLDIAWLIPIAPTLGALFIFLLLVSFDRTINRLTKPVSYLLIICVTLSTILSFTLFEKHLSGNALDLDLIILGLPFHFGLYVDKLASLLAASFGLLVLLIMIFSYYTMDRKKGYVAYFVLLGLMCGSVFSFVYSGDLFHKYF